MKQSWKIVFVHFILIVFFLSVPILSSPDFDLSFRMFDVKPFQRSFFSYVMVILFFYFHYYLIIPRLFEQKKMVLYWGTIILSFIAIASLLHFSFVNGIPNEHNNFGPPPADFGPDHGMPGPRFVLIENLSFIIPFLLILLFSHYLRANRRTKQVEFDKVQTELQNLKYQLQPHFLFNSLNNIYSISIIDHKRTPHYILQLSEILRYLLQTEKAESVALKDEIRFCEQYVELQQLRFGEEQSSNWQIELKVESESLVIAPFLLIPLVENVFKYGINADKHSPIKISVELIGDELKLETYNKKNNEAGEALLISHKIGLNKTQERLELLYAGKNQLSIVETTDDYSLTLRLKLSNEK